MKEKETRSSAEAARREAENELRVQGELSSDRLRKMEELSATLIRKETEINDIHLRWLIQGIRAYFEIIPSSESCFIDIRFWKLIISFNIKHNELSLVGKDKNY